MIESARKEMERKNAKFYKVYLKVVKEPINK